MKHKISSIIACSLFSVASCMQAEKVSLDTSGAEGLLLSGLSIELGLFGGSGGGGTTCYEGGVCKIAVTAATYDGALDGISGADLKCQAEFPGYKALLFSNTPGKSRDTVTDWVLKPATTYVRRTGGATIGTTNASSVFDFVLTNSWDQTSNQVWTGAETSWTISSTTCSNWTSATPTGAVGLTITNKPQALSNGAQSCGIALYLLCVEQ